MKTSATNVQSLLEKLDSSLNRKKKKTTDWSEVKKAIWKPKNGENNILVFVPAYTGEPDPFIQWGYHQGLQEVSYYSVPCDAMNKGEDCIICDVVDNLKKEDFEGNKHLWYPIEQKIEHYAPIIDLDDVDAGPKWFRIGKLVLGKMVDELRNLEEGEFPFYDANHPKRIKLTYNKDEAPANKYSLAFKDLKDKDIIAKIPEWAEQINPINEYIFSKSQDQLKKMVDEYFVRIAEVIDDSMEDEATDESEAVESTEDTAASAKSKLSKLKESK